MRTITKRDLIEGLKRGDIERREAAKALLALKPNLPSEEDRVQEAGLQQLSSATGDRLTMAVDADGNLG